jgi:hypothetical protein
MWGDDGDAEEGKNGKRGLVFTVVQADAVLLLVSFEAEKQGIE